MKKLITTLVFSSLLCLPLGASVSKVGFKIFEKPKSYADTGIGFELINKSNKPLWMSVKNGTAPGAGTDKIEPGSTTQYKISIDDPTIVAVWYTDPKTGTKRIKREAQPQPKPRGLLERIEKWITQAPERAGALIEEVLIAPTPDKEYAFTKGKTIYLTWDKEGFARPQTGPLKGILNKTDSGLSLKNNVTTSDIKQL